MPENTKSRLRQAGATHLFTLLCLLAWCVASWVSPAYQMPSPIAVLRGMGEFLSNINLLEQLGASLFHVAMAIFLSFLIGAVLALIPISFPIFRRSEESRGGKEWASTSSSWWSR